MEFREDRDNELYQQGVAARKAGTPRCPYEPRSAKAYYWSRGYADAANPPPDGVMVTSSHFTPRAETSIPAQMMPELIVFEPGGATLIRMAFMDKGCLLSTAEIDAFGAHVQRLLEEHPFEMKTRNIFRGKEFLAAKFDSSPSGEKTAKTSTRVARAVDGIVRVPVGATLDANGEIVVPSRSLDTSSPSAKSFRRACRAARNAIREIAEREGRPVSVVTQEMREKSV